MCTLQTLYESSIAFGMRKALQTEAGKSDMEQRINTLEAEAKDLERQVELQHISGLKQHNSWCKQVECRWQAARSIS